MVATRRGTRAGSPTKSNSDELVDVSATPSRSGRRTGTRQQPASQPPKAPGGDEEHLKGQTSTTKRTTRASRVQSPQLDSTHEADVSDSESCTSAASEPDHPILRRGRRKTPGRSSNQSADLSDVESCSSANSASRVGLLTRRGQTKSAAAGGSGQSESILMESEESCGSVVSDTQRVTRSLRRNVMTRCLTNLGVEDTGDVSEADSSTSSPSAAPSTSRRPARSRTSRSAKPIPMNLEEASDLPQSPAPSRRTRGARAAAVVDPGAWDSEGFESGPSVTPRRSNRKRTATRYTCSGATDSDESPPVSSQTGSRSRSLSRLSVVVERARISVVQETGRGLEEGADMVEMPTEKPCHLGKVSVSQGAEEESVLEDSKLDATIGPEDVTLTLEKEEEEKEEEEKDEEEKEEEVIDLTDQDEPVAAQGFCQSEESQGGGVIVSEEEPVEVSEASNEPACGPAVATADQQGEQQLHSAAETEEDTAAMSQETEAAAELELCTGDTRGVTVCYDPETADKEGEEEDINVTSSSSAHSPELDDACHLVLSDEEGEQEKVEVVMLEEKKVMLEKEQVVEGEGVMLEEEKAMLEEEQEQVVEGEVVMLEEEKEDVVVIDQEEEKEEMVVIDQEEEKEDVVVIDQEEKKEEMVVIDQEEEKEDVVVIDQEKKEEIVVIQQEEEDVVVLEEQQEEEAVVVERKETQVTVLKEQEEVAEEENKEEVNVVIEKKVDSVSVVMEEDEEMEEGMEVSVSAPQVLHTGSEAAFQPLLPDSIQVNSSQEIKVVVSELQQAEQPHGSIIIQKTKVVSLLDSSEDEEEEESSGEEEEEEEEDEDDSEDLAGPSHSKPASDDLFVIDKRPGQQDGLFHPETNEEAGPVSDDEEEFVDEEGDEEEDDDDKALFTFKNQTSMELSSRIDAGLRARELGGLYVCFDGGKPKGTPSNDLQKKKRNIEDQVMQRSVIGPEFEKQEAVPPYSESKQALKLKRKEEREKTTGDGWFNMRAPEMTAELKGDLKALKMRAAMDPKRFYKKNDRDGFPKYFQMGTVVDSPVDFYHSRIPKKNRKRTMVEELLADAEFRHSNKKKYQQIMTEKAALGAGRKRNRNLTNRKKTKNDHKK